VNCHAEAFSATVGVPVPCGGRVLEHGRQGDIQWFKQLSEKDEVHNMDTFGQKETAWHMAHGGGKWGPTIHLPRPDRWWWDWMCHALYE
jgi:hypothetical protein